MTSLVDGTGTQTGPGARAAARVGAGIFLSRVAGFLREAVFAYYFGASAVADVWRAALRTPNVIQNLLGEGTLSASFIPVYAELLEEGREEDAGRLAGAILGILSVVAFGFALLGILLAPPLIRLFFFEWEPWMQALGIRLVRILFPMTAVLVLSAWALGVLNSHRRFFVSYVAPVAWNLALVAAMVGFGTYLGWDRAGRDAELVVALAWGGVVGGVAQLAVQLPTVRSVLHHFRLSLGRGVQGVREAIHNFWPVLLARGVLNLSSWLDVVLAGILSLGAIALLGYAQTLYLLPISLFGMAVAASELPELSRRRGEGREILGGRVASALARTRFLLLPSALAYLALGDLFIAALFQRGEFDRDATAAAYAVLAAYSLGILASASSRVLSSAFYALRDTRTPAKLAYVRVAVSVAVGVALMFPLDRIGVGTLRLGAVGLAGGASAGAWVEYLLLRRNLARRIGSHGPPPGHGLRVTVAALAATAGGLAGKALLGSRVPLHDGVLSSLAGAVPWLEAPLQAAGTGLAFGVVYLATARLLGIGAPLRSLLRRGGGAQEPRGDR